MNRLPFAALALLSFFFPMPAFGAPDVLVLGSQEFVSIRAQEFLLDAESSLAPEELSGRAVAKGWQTQPGVLNLGYTRSSVWVRFPIQAGHAGEGRWLLEIAYANLDEVNVWISSGGGIVSAYETGDTRPFATRPIQHRNFVIPLTFAPGEKLEVLLRIATTTSLQVPMKLWREGPFHQEDQRVQLLHGMFFGIMLVMAVYNFFIFVAIRERAYLFYVVFVIMEGAYQAFHQGFTFQHLWPQSIWWHSVSGGLFISLTIAFAAFFSREILEARKRLPRMGVFFGAAGAIACGIGACSLILDHSITARAISMLSIVAAPGILGAGAYLWRKGFRPAKPFTLAWAAFLGGGFLFAFNKLGLIGHNIVTEYGLQFGATLEVMLLSFALGQRINEERREKFFTKLRLLDEQILLRQAYERFVPRRFLALLGKESITDVELGDHVQRKMTILFSDIRSFTSLSEKMAPRENFSFLNAYLKRMEPIIDRHGGFVDKYIGDCIMALFHRKPDDAVAAAVAMMEALREHNQSLVEARDEPFEIGIGINHGEMMLGTIGTVGRMEGTVISDAVNTASRVESLTKIYGTPVLITEAVRNQLENPSRFDLRILDKVRVKGREEPVVIYEVLNALSTPMRKLRMSYAQPYEQALGALWRADFSDALAGFLKCEALAPDDAAVQLFVRRCRWHARQGGDSEWSGVFDAGAVPGGQERS